MGKKTAKKKNNPGKEQPVAEATVERNGQEELPEPKKDLAREFFEILMYGLSLLIFFKGFVWQNFQIPTSSMENTLLIGDHITANTFMFKNASSLEKSILPYRDIRRGDVVVFKWPRDVTKDYIKRCVGLPGDEFYIKDSVVHINGEPLDEAYTYYKDRGGKGTVRDSDNRYLPMDYDTLKPGLKHAQDLDYGQIELADFSRLTERWLYEFFRDDRDTDHYKDIWSRLQESKKKGDNVIPDDFYLMMGDNRNFSLDSRGWGLVPREFVEGRAYFVWWSYGEDKDSHKLKGWELIKSYLRVPITFWTRTHWKESFARIK